MPSPKRPTPQEAAAAEAEKLRVSFYKKNPAHASLALAAAQAAAWQARSSSTLTHLKSTLARERQSRGDEALAELERIKELTFLTTLERLSQDTASISPIGALGAADFKTADVVSQWLAGPGVEPVPSNSSDPLAISMPPPELLAQFGRSPEETVAELKRSFTEKYGEPESSIFNSYLRDGASNFIVQRAAEAKLKAAFQASSVPAPVPLYKGFNVDAPASPP